jgi:hypothetical protein
MVVFRFIVIMKTRAAVIDAAFTFSLHLGLPPDFFILQEIPRSKLNRHLARLFQGLETRTDQSMFPNATRLYHCISGDLIKVTGSWILSDASVHRTVGS